MNIILKNRTVTIFLAFIVLLIIVLIIVTETRPTGIKSQGFLNSASSQSVDPVYEQIDLIFSNPVKQSIISKISIQPEVGFKSFWQGDRIKLVFDDVLLSNQNYRVSITNAVDVFGEDIPTQTFDFKTKDDVFAYQSGNTIVSHNLSTNVVEKVYTSNSTISDYDITNDYLVISENVGQSNTLKIVDLNNFSEKYSIENVLINSIEIAKNGRFALVVIQDTDVDNILGVIPSGNPQAYIFRLANDIRREKLSTGIENEGYLAGWFAPDNSAILLKQVSGDYIILDWQDPTSFRNMGRHMAFNGFNRDGDKMIFTDLPLEVDVRVNPIVGLYDPEQNVEIIHGGKEFVVDNIVFPRSNEFVYARNYAPYEGGKGYFEIVKSNTVLINTDGFSFELPLPSPTGNLLLAEKYSTDQLNYSSNFRTYEFQIKPAEGSLILYDMEKQVVVLDDIPGINAKWL